MLPSKPRSLDELLSSIEVGRLTDCISSCYMAALDQVIQLWSGVFDDCSPRLKRQFVRNDLQRIVESEHLSTAVLPDIRSAFVTDRPLFTFREGDEVPDFDHLERRLRETIPTTANLRKTKVYVGGRKFTELYDSPTRYEHTRLHHLRRPFEIGRSWLQRDAIAGSEVPLFLDNCSASLLFLTDLYLRKVKGNECNPPWIVNHIDRKLFAIHDITEANGPYKLAAYCFARGLTALQLRRFHEGVHGYLGFPKRYGQGVGTYELC